VSKITKTYRTARAFRVAVADRLQRIARETASTYEDLYRRVALDRFLARVDWDNWIAKGGYVLQRRLPHARRTKDIDLAVIGKRFVITESEELQSTLLAELQEFGKRNIQDYFSFEVEFDRFLPAFGKGGVRCIARCMLDAQLWTTFRIDAVVQDRSVFPTENLRGDDFFSFAGITPLTLRVPSKEEVFAEKIHAYTTPRDTENTRVKDLLDLQFLLEDGVDEKRVKKAIIQVFEIRNTHERPLVLERPPRSWAVVFNSLASTTGSGTTLEQAFTMVDQIYRRLRR